MVESWCPWLKQLTDDNAQKEFLLTDIVRYANDGGSIVKAYKTNDPVEVTGINTFTQLARLERTLQRLKAQQLMDQGVQLMDPARIDVRGNLVVGRGVSIDVNTIFEGEVTIGDDVAIGPNCVITDSQIGTGPAQPSAHFHTSRAAMFHAAVSWALMHAYAPVLNCPKMCASATLSKLKTRRSLKGLRSITCPTSVMPQSVNAAISAQAQSPATMMAC